MTPKENFLRVINRNNPEYIPYYYAEENSCGLVEIGTNEKGFENLESRKTGEECYDAWGVKWRQGMEKIFPYVEKSPLKTLKDIQNYQPPDPHDPNLFKNAARTLNKIDRENFIVLATYTLGPFERSWTLIGMEKILELMLVEPDLLYEFIGKVTDHHIVIAKGFVKLGIDIGGMTDDYGIQHSLMMAPGLWRKIIKPHLRRYVNAYKEEGLMVNLHTCGSVATIVDDFIEIGIDLLHPVQATANNHPEFKQKWGDRLTFFGGVNAHILFSGKPEDVVQETKTRLAQLGPGGGYICAPDQGLPFPDENITAFKQTVEKFGKYPLDWIDS